MSAPFLYHGTNSSTAILAEDRLRVAPFGETYRSPARSTSRPEGDWHSNDEEQEESIWVDVHPLSRYLVDVVRLDGRSSGMAA